MAMQGKMVEQRPEEGTGEELYRQIQKEKQKLIKEGKIKKEKPLPEITEDEMPFEIPESWKWVRWGEVINVVSARRVHQSDWKTTGIPFYRAREIAKLAENGNVDNELFISQQLFDEFSKFGVPHPGDLMVTAVGTLGRTYIVQPEDHFYYKDASVLCFENFADINAQYLKVAMDSELMGAQIKSNSGGTTVSTLTIVRMNDYLLPLPPLAEQKRIVAKIEEIMPYIDRYAVAYDHLQSYNTRFPDDLKKSILQQAMEGKLSSQWREDNRVDINSWHKMTVADACHEVKVGIVIRPTRYYTDSTGYKAFRSTNVREFHVQNSDWVYINQKGQDENPRTVVHTGDVLIVRSGNTGTACVVPEEYDGCSGIDIIIAVPNKQIIDPEFLCIFTNSPVGKTQINSGTKGMALTHFGAKSYAKLSINVPSLEEQHYIVEQVKRILPKITMLSRVS